MTTTGADFVALARTRLGQAYVLGANVPLDDREYAGPWDCAEFATWLAYQLRERLVGCVDNEVPVAKAEPYSGGWAHDAARGLLLRTTVDAALATPGVFLVRAPARGAIGHVALSDGTGGTVEAHSRKHGVSAHRVSGRRWDHACLLAGVEYRSAVASPLPTYHAPAVILREGSRGPLVVALKRALAERGYWQQPLESVTAPIFGPMTTGAVARFQVDHGLVRDGEAGPLTFRELGLAS